MGQHPKNTRNAPINSIFLKNSWGSPWGIVSPSFDVFGLQYDSSLQKAENVSADSLVFCTLVPAPSPGPPLDCPPAFKYLIFSRDGKWVKYLMRGDARGRLSVWKIPDTPECAAMQLAVQEGKAAPTSTEPFTTTSLEEVWQAMVPSPPGVLSQLEAKEEDIEVRMQQDFSRETATFRLCGDFAEKYDLWFFSPRNFKSCV